MLNLTEQQARRLAVTRQGLAGPRPGSVEQVFGLLRCLQLDPINVVARSHLLVLWSRLGAVDESELDRLQWSERAVFEYWAHAASLVLAEDYPIHQVMMRSSPGDPRRAKWLADNPRLRAHVLERLAEGVPLAIQDFDDVAEVPWTSTGWTNGRNVERMLETLWTRGEVTIAGRRGRTRLWGTARWGEHTELSRAEAVDLAAQHALRALGVARRRDIEQHFVRDRYPGLEEILAGAAWARPVRVEGEEGWFVHTDVLDAPAAWEPRATVLSPFDNLICDRKRAERLWGFSYKNEMYVPREKREFGYYVLPILDGERLTGRVAPRLDRRTGILDIEGLYAEPGAPVPAGILSGLAEFVGARDLRFSGPIPEVWRDSLAVL
ncbi:MAG: winged helix-turn-helix domain-containing protein [Nonomuraea sp.]|nr:winged helix-turn-helix domain-containing protein [Nonomuraea sp.]